MPLLNFGPEYHVGVREVDTQHINLIRLINELHDAMRRRSGRELIESTLRRTLSYTRYHFRTEDTLMLRHAYPRRLEHGREHAELIRRVESLRQQLKDSEVGVVVETLDFLTQWLSHHILVSDKQLAAFLNDQGVG